LAYTLRGRRTKSDIRTKEIDFKAFWTEMHEAQARSQEGTNFGVSVGKAPLSGEKYFKSKA